MRILSVSLSILALAAAAGCAQQSGTREMGASSAAGPRVVYCRDGAWVSNAGACGTHGGVERDMSTPAQK